MADIRIHKAKNLSKGAIAATVQAALDSFGEDVRQNDPLRAPAQALRAAAAKSDAKPFKEMVAAGTATDMMYYAAEHGETEIVRQLLAAGADTGTGEAGVKPLAIAAEHGHAEIARLLIDAGADVNEPGMLGPPIIDAASNGHADVVQLLLERGADPHVTYMADATLLAVAAEANQPAVVPILLKAGVDPNKPGSRERTPIIWAAENGNLQMIRDLLAGGAAVDPPPETRTITDLTKETGSALTFAAKEGHADIVAELLKAGADPTWVDRQGRTAYEWAKKNKHDGVLAALRAAGAIKHEGTSLADLLAAAEAGDVNGVRKAIQAGVDVNGVDKAVFDEDARGAVAGGLPALVLAARAGHGEVVRLLLEHGAKIDELSQNWKGGRRPALTFAAEAGHISVVQQLLDAGATVTLPGQEYNGKTGTALHYAARSGHADIVRLLLSRGADANDKSGGEMPLHAAARNGHLEAIKALVDGGAKIESKEREGNTPLHMAAQNGKLDAVKLLLTRGSKVNSTNKSGQTPLGAGHRNLSVREIHYDAKGNKTVKDPGDPMDVMRALLAAGADPNLPSKRGGGMLIDVAGEPQVVKLLLDHKADPNTADSEGHTALAWAVMRQNVESVQLLLAAGADPNAVDQLGRTSLDLAVDRKYPQIAKLLEKAGAKRAKDLKAGQAIIEREKAKKAAEKKRNAELDAQYAALRPDWTKPAKSAAFKAAVKKITEEAGKESTTSDGVPGAVFFKIPRKIVKSLLAKHHANFLKDGHYLFATGSAMARDDEESLLGLAPTADKYEVMLALGTNAANFGKGPVEVVEELKQIEKEVPFDLTHISFDTLEGQWTGEIKSPGKFAKRLYEFCPDIVDQGMETVAALSKQLKKSKDLFFWWD